MFWSHWLSPRIDSIGTICFKENKFPSSSEAGQLSQELLMILSDNPRTIWFGLTRPELHLGVQETC